MAKEIEDLSKQGLLRFSPPFTYQMFYGGVSSSVCAALEEYHKLSSVSLGSGGWKADGKESVDLIAGRRPSVIYRLLLYHVFI